MLDFRKKKAARKIMYSPWILLLLFVLTLFLVKAAWNVHTKERASSEALARSTAELAKLEAREASLTSAVAYLGTPAGVETEIRTKFRVAKEGELVAVILEDAPTTTSTTTITKGGFWYRLTHLFSGE
jgi:Tfp pilus assembly protein PilX